MGLYNQLLKKRSVVLKEQDNKKVFLLSSISNTKTITCNETGKYLIYKSDRYGFNNPDKEWDKDIVEMFMIGDSFLHGNCVDENDTIGSNFRKLSKKNNNNEFSIINTGQPASGPLVFNSIGRYDLQASAFIKGFSDMWARNSDRLEHVGIK